MRPFSRHVTHTISQLGVISARGVITMLMVLGICSLAKADEPAAEKSPDPTPEHVQQWIEQSGDEDFQTREDGEQEKVKLSYVIELEPPLEPINQESNIEFSPDGKLVRAGLGI